MPKKKLPTIPTPPQAHTEASEYATAAIVGLFFTAVITFYLSYRSGSLDQQILNKALGDASVILLGLILLIGTGSRLFSFPDRWVPYRKEIGIVAFLLGIGHFVVSLFFVPGRYNYTTLLETSNQPAMYGLAALILLLLLFLSSRQKISTMLGTKVWWKFQYWGLRITFILVGIHVILLKGSRWLSWYTQGTTQKLTHPNLPTSDLLLGWFMLVVILIRLSEFFGPKAAKTTWYLSFVSLPLIYAVTFWWGNQLVGSN